VYNQAPEVSQLEREGLLENGYTQIHHWKSRSKLGPAEEKN